MDDIPLLLDRHIRLCVFVPIFVLVVLAALLRQYASLILRADPPKANLQDVKCHQILARARVLRAGCCVLPSTSALARRLYLSAKDRGLLWKPPPSVNPLMAMTQAANNDPGAMFGAMKSQMAFLFLNGGLAYLVNTLFSGFLVAKAPFPLTFRFKSMLQRGVDVSGLDVTYVSSLSWYFIILFGSTGLLQIINVLVGQDMSLDDPAMSAMAMLGPMAGGGAMMPGMGAPDMKSLFQQERDNLELTCFDFGLQDADMVLYKSWKKSLSK